MRSTVRFAAWLAAVVLMVAPAVAAPPVVAGLPTPPRLVRLENGLRVALAPDPEARAVSVVVSYGAGSADDPNGRRGLAHLTEHVVARRTKHVEDLKRVLESAGAWGFNAQTSPDATTYFESVPAERLETVLWLESDRMGFVSEAITESSFAEAREVVRNEHQDRAVDGMFAGVAESARHELFPSWHPYSASADGSADVDSIDARDVRAFVSTWYTPENATLAIAGRFDEEKTLALVKRYFESLPSRPAPSRPALPPWNPPRINLALTAPVPTHGLMLAWRTPALRAEDDAALDLVATILAGSGNERFARALIATHLVTTLTAHQHSARADSVFYVNASAAPGVTPAVVAAAVEAVLDALVREVTPSELVRARRTLRDRAFGALETSMGRARRLAAAARSSDGLAPSWDLDRYERVSVRDVQRLVATWLGPAHRVTVAVLSDPDAPRRGTLVAREDVDP